MSVFCWADQLNYTVKNPLHFIMHILKKGNSNLKSLTYMSLVHPVLEYGSACWDPYREGKIYFKLCAKERSYICKSYELFGLGNLGAS